MGNCSHTDVLKQMIGSNEAAALMQERNKSASNGALVFFTYVQPVERRGKVHSH
jgi:hypothetical protein